MTHMNHIRSIIFNATVLHEVIAKKTNCIYRPACCAAAYPIFLETIWAGKNILCWMSFHSLETVIVECWHPHTCWPKIKWNIPIFHCSEQIGESGCTTLTMNFVIHKSDIWNDVLDWIMLRHTKKQRLVRIAQFSKWKVAMNYLFAAKFNIWYFDFILGH